MGPQASLELHRRMIQQALADGAKDGMDFPYIVHLSLPVPDFIANESRRSEALEIIINELKNILPAIPRIYYSQILNGS